MCYYMDVKRQQSGQNWTHSASWSSPRSDCTQHCTNTVLSFQPTSCPSFSNRPEIIQLRWYRQISRLCSCQSCCPSLSLRYVKGLRCQWLVKISRSASNSFSSDAHSQSLTRPKVSLFRECTLRLPRCDTDDVFECICISLMTVVVVLAAACTAVVSFTISLFI